MYVHCLCVCLDVHILYAVGAITVEHLLQRIALRWRFRRGVHCRPILSGTVAGAQGCRPPREPWPALQSGARPSGPLRRPAPPRARFQQEQRAAQSPTRGTPPWRAGRRVTTRAARRVAGPLAAVPPTPASGRSSGRQCLQDTECRAPWRFVTRPGG